MGKCIFWRKATNRCKKFKFWHFWECPLYEISEYAFKFAMGYEQNISFFVIQKSSEVWKKVDKIGLGSFKSPFPLKMLICLLLLLLFFFFFWDSQACHRKGIACHLWHKCRGGGGVQEFLTCNRTSIQGPQLTSITGL